MHNTAFSVVDFALSFDTTAHGNLTEMVHFAVNKRCRGNKTGNGLQ